MPNVYQGTIGKPNHKIIESEIVTKFDDVRKKFGLFFTPDKVIDLMIEIKEKIVAELFLKRGFPHLTFLMPFLY